MVDKRVVDCRGAESRAPRAVPSGAASSVQNSTDRRPVSAAAQGQQVRHITDFRARQISTNTKHIRVTPQNGWYGSGNVQMYMLSLLFYLFTRKWLFLIHATSCNRERYSSPSVAHTDCSVCSYILMHSMNRWTQTKYLISAGISYILLLLFFF